MRMNRKFIGLLATTLTVAAMGNVAAHADILPQVGSPTVSASGTGTFLYSYTILVSDTQQVQTNDFFTIYDFNGFVNVRSNPATFSFVAENLSAPVVTGQGTVMPNDNATVPNVRFVYTGVPTLMGPQTLGTFVIESLYAPGTTPTTFIGRGTDQVTGLKNANITNVIAPGVVPEPSEYAFAAFAGAGILGLVLRARRKSGATRSAGGTLAAA